MNLPCRKNLVCYCEAAMIIICVNKNKKSLVEIIVPIVEHYFLFQTFKTMDQPDHVTKFL